MDFSRITEKVMQFKRVRIEALVNTALGIGTIALGGFALYAIATFLENLGKSSN